MSLNDVLLSVIVIIVLFELAVVAYGILRYMMNRLLVPPEERPKG